MNKTHIATKIFWSFFILSSLITFPKTSTKAYAAGLNSENFYPALDYQSALMWESAKTIPSQSLLWAYTFDYALRPIEFGDGGNKRVSLSDHIQINHFGLAYGFTQWLDGGLSLPIALYSGPRNPEGYLQTVGTEKRKFFFLADPKARVKFNFVPGKKNDGFYGGALLSILPPLGNGAAMLTDDATRFSVEFPMHVAMGNNRFELFFTPGAGFWSQEDRLQATQPNTLATVTLVKKSQSLLINTGLRYWFNKRGQDSGRGIQLEGGIRGDYADFRPSLNERASPTEWSGGAAWYLSQALSLHADLGGGVGSGVGAPLTRLSAGVRYLNTPPPPPTPAPAPEPAPLPVVSEQEMNRIVQEPPPPRTEDDSMLRIVSKAEVIDIGPIRFEFNSARLTPAAKQTVALLHEQLKRLRPQSIAIEGHTDSVGSMAYNLNLSKRRAESVKAELILLGQNGAIIKTQGYAFKHPITSNGTRSGRAMNRRIEVALDGHTSRKLNPSREEQEAIKRWIYPRGRQPKAWEDLPDL